MAASTASHYPNSQASASQKWPRDLAPFFRSSDLPDHLRETVIVMLQRDRYGAQLWMSKVRLAIELGVCRRTAQRRVRRLVELKVLKEISPANSYFRNDPEKFRPSATYEANPEAVKTRPTWKDFESLRPTHRRLTVKSASQHHRRLPSRQPIPISSAPAPAVDPIAPVALTKAESAAQFLEAMRGGPGEKHRDPLSAASRGVREIRTQIVNAVTELTRPRKTTTPSHAITQCNLQLAQSSIQPKPAAAPDPWAEILNSLRRRVNPHGFETWLKPTRLRGISGKQIFVAIPSRDFAHVGEKFSASIQDAVTDLCLGYEQIVFEWRETIAEEAPPLCFREAVLKACHDSGIPLEAALDATGWKKKYEESEASP